MLYRLLLLMFILPSFAMAAATYETAHIERHGNSYEVLADYPQFKNPNAQEQKANKSIKRFVHSLFDKDLKGRPARCKYPPHYLRSLQWAARC